MEAVCLTHTILPTAVMADEMDWLEMLVASERIEKWLSIVCRSENSLASRWEAAMTACCHAYFVCILAACLQKSSNAAASRRRNGERGVCRGG